MLGNPVSPGILHYKENYILDKLWQKMRERWWGSAELFCLRQT